ncbi:RNA-binding protein 34-like [Homarus americanus]|uniref:RNA-binding protein 34-like n=1 Tax=Homarus americanus TaxID=6706 RepID=A0A8J5MK97_HOMAM|nr:RNA-binding protein 34-like [Homarus americanus]KAG7154327.1 RNA-binding protein 34-like [Homarus americanus]
MKKKANKKTEVKPDPVAKSPDKTITKKKNKKKKKKNLANINDSVEELKANVTVVDASAIPKKNKKKKKKKKTPGNTQENGDTSVVAEKNQNKENGDVTIAEAPGIKKKRRRNKKKKLGGIVQNGNTSADAEKIENMEGVEEKKDTPMTDAAEVNGDSSAAPGKNKNVNTEENKDTAKAAPKKIKRVTNDEEKEKDTRTVFVGNVNIKTKRKEISRLFNKYGKVEAVRFRNAAVPEPQKSKKEAVIKSIFHESRSSLSAYVRFETVDMMEAALEANGIKFNEKHLRVDRAVASDKRDVKCSLFIGNLTFEAEEEALRQHFIDCGEIESVRIIRDKKMASGKGFGYVNFMSPDSVEVALNLNKTPFMGRLLRVQRCLEKVKKPKEKKLGSPAKKGLAFMKPIQGKEEKTKPKPQGDFSGKKMLKTKEFKKVKKAKGKLTKTDKKKLSVARQLTGAKPKVKKT